MALYKKNEIKETDKVCYNCKHLLWLVGVGQGLRCGFDMNKTKPIPSSMYTCDKFKYNEKT